MYVLCRRGNPSTLLLTGGETDSPDPVALKISVEPHHHTNPASYRDTQFVRQFSGRLTPSVPNLITANPSRSPIRPTAVQWLAVAHDISS